MKIHIRDLRLFVNAGMEFPTCYSNAELLDLEKGRLPTSDFNHATCKHCKRIYKKRYK